MLLRVNIIGMLTSIDLDLAVHLISPLKLQTVSVHIVVNMNTLHIVYVNATYSPSAHERDKALLRLLHGIKERCTWIIVSVILWRLLLVFILQR